MSHEERIDRLTQLARRVWNPRHHGIEVATTGNFASVSTDGGAQPLLEIHFHVRALDALEAALLVLVGDDTRMELGRLREQVRDVLAEELAKRNEAAPLHKIHADGTVERVEPPAWVEGLAAQWEQEARSVREIATHCEYADEDGQLHLIWVAEAYDKRAAELRQAAKGAP